MRGESQAKLGAASAMSNLAFATIKVLVGLTGNSYALIADGIESIADVFSSLIVWNGLRVAAKEPDEGHPYGHGKAESVAGLVAACALVVSAGVIGVNAVQELLAPHVAPSSFVLPTLVGIIAAKELLFRWLLKASERAHSPALLIEAWHHRMDALTSLGVLVGVAIASLGGPALAGADDVAALLVSGLIVYNAGRLAKPAIDELLDRDVSSRVADRIHAIAEETRGVARLESLQVRKSGPCHLVDVHLEVDGSLTVREGHRIAHDLKDRLLADASLRITHVMTHVEPTDDPPKQGS